MNLPSEVGGMILTPESIESEDTEKTVVGSLMIVQAETFNDAKKLVESDVYYTSGVVSCSSRVLLSPHFPSASGIRKKSSFCHLFPRSHCRESLGGLRIVALSDKDHNWIRD
jgi:hypothetical protein